MLRLADDLKFVGIKPLLDLIYPSSSTSLTAPLLPSHSHSFSSILVTHLLSSHSHSSSPRPSAHSHLELTLLSWMKTSDVVLLLGSPSYAKQAADPSTYTHKESQILSEKRANHPSSVLPLLLAGEFSNSFPDGYASTLGANISTLALYFQNFPSVMATILNLQHDPEISMKLRKYESSTEDLLQNVAAVVPNEREQLMQQNEVQHKAWIAKMFVLKAQFTPEQLYILDGKIKDCEEQIAAYCEKMEQELEPCKVPQLADSKVPLETQLMDFLHNRTEKVLLLLAPPRSHKNKAAKFLAYTAWCKLRWVPVVVSLQHLKTIDDKCIAQVLQTKQLSDAAILHAQTTKSFLLVIEGFDKSSCQVNIYVHKRFEFVFRS